MGLGIPPLKIKIVLESNPLKPTMLVGRSGVQCITQLHNNVCPDLVWKMAPRGRAACGTATTATFASITVIRFIAANTNSTNVMIVNLIIICDSCHLSPPVPYVAERRLTRSATGLLLLL